MALKLRTEYDVAHLEELQRVVSTATNPAMAKATIQKNLVIGVVALLASVGVITMIGIGITAIVLAVMGLYLLWRGTFFYKACGRDLRKKMDKEFTHNDYVLEDDFIQVSSPVGSKECSYEDCTRLLETNQNIYMMMEDGQGLILDKFNLEGGNEEELRALLEEKTGKTLEWMDRKPRIVEE